MITVGTEKEALINELKGNLFEYLLAFSLAKIHKVEANFFQTFEGEIKEKLTVYEGHLLKNDPYLFKKLPLLAKDLAQKLNRELPKKIDNILVVGKDGFHFNLKEADLIVLSGAKKIPLSIKLCKANSFVNTKSAGVKSFIKRYFKEFSKAESWQNDLNIRVDLSFEKMGKKLYQMVDLEFPGRFSDEWSACGFSDLPGKLPMEMKKIVRDFYFEINSKIYEIFMEMERISKRDLKEALFPLLGFGDKTLIQATCFHGEVRGEKYCPLKTSIGRLDNVGDPILGALKKDLSSFELKFPGRVLQIRVKPMNVFTTPAVKINCSTKEII